jgi:hypothetical protein
MEEGNGNERSRCAQPLLRPRNKSGPHAPYLDIRACLGFEGRVPTPLPDVVFRKV